MTAEDEGRAAAERFRSKHHLGDQPLGDLITLVEQTTGFDVAVLEVDQDEHGMAIRDTERGVVFIAVARTRNPMRQRSSLAHELGHVLHGDWTEPAESPAAGSDTRGREETRADAFARHLLIPLEGLRQFLADQPDHGLAVLSAAVQRFLVSPAMAAIALQQTGHIDDRTKSEWMAISTPTLAARFGWSDQYAALQDESDRKRAPQRLLARAVEGYVEGVVSLQTLATLRGADAAVVAAELDKAGLSVAQRTVAWTASADLPKVDVDLSDLEESRESDTG
jgi:Zn-dependent peptidase ImmA (M78 family)